MRDLTCEQCRDLLPWHANHTLNVQDEAAVQHHLAGCADCQSELAQWQAIIVSSQTAYNLMPAPSAVETARIIAATRRRLPPHTIHQSGALSMTAQSTDAPPTKPANGTEPTRPSRSPFPLVAAFLLSALVILLAGISFQHFARNNAGARPHPATVVVPDFTHETLAQAKSQAAQLGLTLQVNDAINNAPAGTIFHQNPQAGIIIMLPQQSMVEVDVSLGPHPNATPAP